MPPDPLLITSAFTHDTEWPADTVEFVPGRDDLLALGTYLLHEATETTPMSRSGKLSLIRLAPEPVVLQDFTLGAVTDIKWRDRVAAAATADGTIALFDLDNDSIDLLQRSELRTAVEGVLSLALDWSPDGTKIAVSHSDGSLATLDVGSGSSESWHACDFECWAVAWDRSSQNVVYSGGDDLKWKIWDVRESLQTATFTSRRRDAGVTTISPSPHEEHLIALGSYDSTVSLYDKRSPREPLTVIDVGGGAWRVKWHPSSTRKDHLLVACMHDGFKVCDVSGNLIARMDEHQSLAYGADWSRGPALAGEHSTVVSCSFYDHMLKIWNA